MSINPITSPKNQNEAGRPQNDPVKDPSAHAKIAHVVVRVRGESSGASSQRPSRPSVTQVFSSPPNLLRASLGAESAQPVDDASNNSTACLNGKSAGSRERNSVNFTQIESASAAAVATILQQDPVEIVKTMTLENRKVEEIALKLGFALEKLPFYKQPSNLLSVANALVARLENKERVVAENIGKALSLAAKGSADQQGSIAMVQKVEQLLVHMVQTQVMADKKVACIALLCAYAGGYRIAEQHKLIDKIFMSHPGANGYAEVGDLANGAAKWELEKKELNEEDKGSLFRDGVFGETLSTRLVALHLAKTVSSVKELLACAFKERPIEELALDLDSVNRHLDSLDGFENFTEEKQEKCRIELMEIRCRHFVELAGKVLTKVYEAQFSPELISFLRERHRIVSSKFPGMGDQMVMSLIFLRVLNADLLAEYARDDLKLPIIKALCATIQSFCNGTEPRVGTDSLTIEHRKKASEQITALMKAKHAAFLRQFLSENSPL